MSTVCAIVCAAGRGNRAGFDKNKLLVPFDGSTALEKTLSVFDCSLIDEIVVTASELDFAEITQIAKSYARTRVVLGGQTRLHSVHGALKTVRSEIVLIHDGARPLVTTEVIDRAVLAAVRCGAAAPAVPVKDTVKVVRKDDSVEETLNRSALRAVQTPQVFDAVILKAALQDAIDKEIPITDDCSAVERIGKTVFLVEGDEENLKITTPIDMILAEAILRRREGRL